LSTKFVFKCDTTITNAYISTQEAAQILGVSTSTLENWRTRKLFGCPFFSADKKFGDTWYYLRERVEQLKEVYQKGILQSMYKLARKFSDNFQKSPSSPDIEQRGNSGVTQHPKKEGFFTADEVAEIFGVDEITIRRWRKQKIFQEDILDHYGVYWYSKERVEQLKAVYHKGWNKIYKSEVRTQYAGNKKSSKLPANFKQEFENLPKELLTQARFFELLSNDKADTPKGWNKPENQKLYSKFAGTLALGMDTAGHGIRISYLFLDFDHVLKNGDFVCDSSKKFVDQLQAKFPNIYIEYSQSGNGLHAFLKPTAENFVQLKMAASDTATLYFTESRENNSPQLECFYNTAAKYCLITGHTFGLFTGAEIPEGEEVDEFLNSLLDKIKAQQPKKEKNTQEHKEKIHCHCACENKK